MTEMSLVTRHPRSIAALVAALVATLVAMAVHPRHAAAIRPGIWISPAQIRALPEHGPAWKQLVRIASGPLGPAKLWSKDNEHDTNTLAVAMVSARTGQARLRAKAAAGIMAAIGTERRGRTLGLGRGLIAYVVAADLIDLRHFDAGKDRRFRAWLSAVRTERLRPGLTLVSTHELRPNNWGTLAGASREAADVYLGDARDLARAAKVFKGWLGDRSAYTGFEYGSLSWQANRRSPVGVDPPGSSRNGRSLDGALPDDMRRGCGLRFPPCPTKYPWEALQGAVAQAEILSRQGYDAFNWEHKALLRAASFLYRLHQRYHVEDWYVPHADTWIPWLLNARYRTHFPTTSPAAPGRGIGYTDWTAAAGR